MNWVLFQNSVAVSVATTVLAVATGFAAAMYLSALEGRWRRGLLAVAVVALALPPFLVTNTWLDLLAVGGKWRMWLPLDIHSIGGAAWILASMTWPLTLLLVLSAWRRIEPAHLEGEPALAGFALIRWLLWPMARIAAGQAAVLTFVVALNNFSVPTILQVKVFPAEMWMRLSTGLDEAAAWAVSWPLVLAPAVLMLVLWRADFDWPQAQGTATAQALRRQLGRGWFRLAAGVTAGALTVSVAVPLTELTLNARTWSELPGLWRAAPAVVWNSVWYAGAGATLCVLLGLAASRMRWPIALWLLFLVPGMLLGRAMMWAFNRPGLDALYGTAALVVFAFGLRYFAIGWAGGAWAMRGVDANLVDAVRLEGASGFSLFRLAHWPQIAGQAAATWYVVYLLGLWDVETLLMIYPPGGETLALRVFNLLHYGHNAQVNAHCVTLLGLAVAPLVARGVWTRVAALRRGQRF